MWKRLYNGQWITRNSPKKPNTPKFVRTDIYKIFQLLLANVFQWKGFLNPLHRPSPDYAPWHVCALYKKNKYKHREVRGHISLPPLFLPKTRLGSELYRNFCYLHFVQYLKFLALAPWWKGRKYLVISVLCRLSAGILNQENFNGLPLCPCQSNFPVSFKQHSYSSAGLVSLPLARHHNTTFLWT